MPNLRGCFGLSVTGCFGLVAPYPPRQATIRILEELGFGDCDCRFGKVMIGDVVGLRGGGEGKIEVGDDVAPLVWLGGVHVGVRFRDDPMGILGACTQPAAETAAAIVIVPPKC